MPLSEKNERLPFGLTLEAITGKDAKERNLEGREGLLVVRIEPSSFIIEERTSNGAPALARGDLIERINRKPVGSLENFWAFARQFSHGDAVVLHVSTYDRNSERIVPRIVQFTVK